MAFQFEKLLIYQKAIDFAGEVCSEIENFSRGYACLVDPLNRAALFDLGKHSRSQPPNEFEGSLGEMKTQPNDGDGKTLILTEGDDLDAVPESHLDMVTDSIRIAFRDPVSYFAEIASRTSIPNMRHYLENFVAGGQWTLLLAETFMMDRDTVAAFKWIHPDQQACMFGVPTSDCDDYRFTPFYRSLSLTHWDWIGYAGGIVPYRSQISVEDYGWSSSNPTFPPDSTTVFGNSACGDMMVCNLSGDAGYLSHETGTSYVIGSFPEMVDWVFGELIQARTPEFDYSRS